MKIHSSTHPYADGGVDEVFESTKHKIMVCQFVEYC